MVLLGCLVDGLSIVGFKLLNAKGEEKNVSYAKTLTLAKQKKVGDVRVTKIDGKDVFVNLDFTALKKYPVQVLSSYRVESQEDGVEKAFVTFDGQEEKEVSLGEFWNSYIGNKFVKSREDKEPSREESGITEIKGPSGVENKFICGMQLEGTSYVKTFCE